MFGLGISSIAVTIGLVVFLIGYYRRQKSRKESNLQKKYVSRKEFQDEIQQLEDYKSNADQVMKKLINDFIIENKKLFDEEENYENKAKLLEKIKGDVDLLTNSFAGEQIMTVRDLEYKYKPIINTLRKQRPSKGKLIQD